MESLVSVPFVFLECPHLKLKKPSWLRMPSPMFMFAVVVIAYFLFTAGNQVRHRNNLFNLMFIFSCIFAGKGPLNTIIVNGILILLRV